jgi:hypothetical protein
MSDWGAVEALLKGLLVVGQMYQTLLAGARYDTRTRWPVGYDPPMYGCVKEPTEVAPAAAPEGVGRPVAAPEVGGGGEE